MYDSDHTPTPWSISGFDPHIVTALRSPGAAWGLENRLATVDVGHPDEEGAREMALKNARHIVKCVNSHDQMLAALQEAHAFLVSLLNMKDVEAVDALGNNGEAVEDALFFAIKEGSA